MAIRTASQKVSAKVEFITGLKTGEFGEYRSVLFLRNDSEGEAAKVWRSFQPHEVSVFSKGQQVYLIPSERKSKATWDVELVESEAIAPIVPAATAHPAAVGIPASQKQAIASHATDLSKLYAFCLKQAKAELPGEDSETIRCAASAVFIALQRKFNLS